MNFWRKIWDWLAGIFTFKRVREVKRVLGWKKLKNTYTSNRWKLPLAEYGRRPMKRLTDKPGGLSK